MNEPKIKDVLLGPGTWRNGDPERAERVIWLKAQKATPRVNNATRCGESMRDRFKVTRAVRHGACLTRGADYIEAGEIT